MSIHLEVRYSLICLGYEVEIQGVCLGVSMRWLEACLLDEETLFDDRIKNIVSDRRELFNSLLLLKRENEKILKKGGKAKPHPEHLLDILAFYDSIELYQSPENHTSLFNRYLTQNEVEAISYFASSDKIVSRGGLVKVYSEPGIYTKTEIKEYLDELGAVLENSTSLSKEPIGILLHNFEHAFALTYKLGAGWKFMDIEQYPTMNFKITETDLIAERIITGFNTIESPYTCFNASVITLGKNPQLPELKCQLEQFKKSHVLTKEIACRKEISGCNLAYIAAANGYADIIAELARLTDEVNLNTKLNIGVCFTAAHTAAQNGHAHVIAELGKQKANLDMLSIKGETPAYIAAGNGHVHVISELAKHNANLNQPNNYGVTPAARAAYIGHADVIAELAIHNANLDTLDNDGETPAFAAAQKGHAHVIDELAKYNVNFDKGAPTPLFKAAQKGHTNTVAKLIEYKANLSLPYTATADSFTQFASKYGESIRSRMAKLIHFKLSCGEKEDSISILPHEIAKVMGHSEIKELLLKSSVSKVNLEPYETKFKNSLRQLKETRDLLNKKARYNNKYRIVALSVNDLYDTLKKEMQAFFAEPSALKFSHCHKNCLEAINAAAKESAQHRGWHLVNPIIRGIIGVLAALTLIPALIVETTSKHGYLQTFFAKPATVTSEKINPLKTQFEKQLNEVDEVLGGLWTK